MKPQVTLKPGKHHRILKGHQWVFSNEIESVTREVQPGDIVQVLRNDRVPMGIGFYNPHSLIAVRILSKEDLPIDFQFFRTRIENALMLRETTFGGGFHGSRVYRCVHGESDFLPGLIIDRYGPVVVIQTLSAGMDRMKTLICDVIESLLSPSAIVEKNESHLRDLEQLPQTTSVLRGKLPNPPLRLPIENIFYDIDVIDGQKTGWFLDQRINHTVIRQFVKGKTVLDAYCYDGGFALNAAQAGAHHVVAFDQNEKAITRAQINAQTNKLDNNVEFICSDADIMFKKFVDGRRQFDVIILDPPSFTRSKKNVPTALRVYQKLHTNAMTILSIGGFLITACCSYHIYEESFLDTVFKSTNKLKRNIQLIYKSGASPDHPVIPAMPETNYLKFAIFHVI